MSQNKKIVIVEDSKAIQFIYHDIFSLKYDVSFISSLEEFQENLDAFNLSKPDLFLIDLILGQKMFHSYLSTDNIFSNLNFPFIVVSSIDDRDILRQCLELGAVDYLTKPIKANELLVKVEHFLEKSCAPTWNEDRDHVDMNQLKFQTQYGPSIDLTRKEAQILTLLLKSRDGRVTKQDLFIKVWENTQVGIKTLDTHLCNLRRKLRAVGFDITCHSNEYRLQQVEKIAS